MNFEHKPEDPENIEEPEYSKINFLIVILFILIGVLGTLFIIQ